MLNKSPKLRKRGKILALALFLLGLILITYLNTWWPAIMLVLGLPLALMQYIQKRYYDMWITLLVFVGVFITVLIKWNVLLPVIFSIGGIYIFFREWSEAGPEDDDKE